MRDNGAADVAWQKRARWCLARAGSGSRDRSSAAAVEGHRYDHHRRVSNSEGGPPRTSDVGCRKSSTLAIRPNG